MDTMLYTVGFGWCALILAVCCFIRLSRFEKRIAELEENAK